MKPSILSAYDKARRVIDSMTIKTIASARRYISIFSQMYMYGHYDANKEWDNACHYREDLLCRFEIKLHEICKELKEK